MAKNKKRFLSAILVFVMCFSLIGVNAFALNEESAETAGNENNNEQVVEQLNDVEDSETTDDPAESEEGIVEYAEVEDPDTTDESVIYVAQIGDTKYQTLDEAIDVANSCEDSNVVIYILKDCSTSDSKSINSNKNITIEPIDDTSKNITLNGSLSISSSANLSLENLNVTTAYKIVMYNAASFNAKNSVVTMNDNGVTERSGSVYYKGAIELEAPCTMNFDASTLNISNYYGSAIRWDANSPYYAIYFNNGSVLNESACYAGFTGTLNVYVNDSTINVNSNRGNGANGTNFYFNNATVNFDGNKSHAISATTLNSNNSKITVSNTNLNAIIAHNVNLASTSLEIFGTKGTSYWNAGIRMYANGVLNIDSKSSVNIHDNMVTGVLLQAGATMNVTEGANVVITDNYATQVNCATKKEAAQCGGGLAVWSGAVANLSDSTQIYNNHAGVAGDDIFVQDGASIILPSVKANVLDGCGHTITGWYYDGYRMTTEENEDYVSAESIMEKTQDQVYLVDYSRWNVVTTMGNVCNGAEETYAYALENQSGENSGILAIKAAHGTVNDTPVIIYTVPEGDPVEEIPEEDVPQADAPEDTTEPAGEETIVEEETPLADAPSAVTGDATIIWIVLALSSVVSLGVIVSDKKHRNNF